MFDGEDEGDGDNDDGDDDNVDIALLPCLFGDLNLNSGLGKLPELISFVFVGNSIAGMSSDVSVASMPRTCRSMTQGLI